jgi:UDP-glucose 4-epimerase
MNILVTGGAGYIGTHVCVELLDGGDDVIVIDNFSNSAATALKRVQTLCGKGIHVVPGDLRDQALVRSIFREHRIDAVIHLAGLKSVGESTGDPLKYYDNNVVGTITLCRTMQEAGVKHLIFSSSATVYGNPQFLPLTEDHPLDPTNPYGQTKLIAENILIDLCHSDPAWRIIMLRYFNPIGAHSSGQIGEDPRGTPNNLLPYIAQVATGQREYLTIFGEDYATPDGTGLRDYIHVVDLAESHVAALRHLARTDGVLAINVGTGRGYTVREVIAEFERASGRRIPVTVAGRRPGDVDKCFADPGLAQRLLGWTAKRGLRTMCSDAWRWQNQNPNGYQSS